LTPPSPAEALAVLRNAERLYDAAQVESALDSVAGRITQALAHANPIVVCVLIGGMVPFGKLVARLEFPMALDYVHATRYRNELRGRELHWLSGPVADPRDRTVLIVDDILDEGDTLVGIEQHFRYAGAADVRKMVLVRKQRPRRHEPTVEFVGLEVPDRYVFGCGMDYKGYWRNLAGIYALAKDA
jgi:hypoxanthine phosphoribosyltransferase